MPILTTANCDDQAGTGGVMKVTPDTECTLVKQTSRQGNDHCFRYDCENDDINILAEESVLISR